MKKKKKGFTLLELIATVVILAIIALIAIPAVMDSVTAAQEQAALNSVEGLIKAGESYYFKTLDTENEVQENENIINLIEYKGKRPQSGEMYIKASGEVVVTAEYGNKCYRKINDTIEIIDDYELCVIPPIPSTPEICFFFDEVEQSITGYDKSNSSCGTDIAIPETINGVAVTKIGAGAFEFDIEEGIEPVSLFKDYNNIQVINNRDTNLTGLYSLSNDSYHFADPEPLPDISELLTSVIIPNSVTIIGERAFASNLLTSVTIPNSVTTIGDYAFFYNQLTSVTIPNSVTTIGESTFDSNQLISVTIPNSVTTIGDYAFSYNQLTSVTIPNSVTTIGEGTFESNQLTSVEIPNSVTTIGDGTFTYNQLTSVEIPNSVTTIGGSAFAGNQLTSVTIPDSVIIIGNSAFSNNDLVSLVIPNSVTTIVNFAFSDNQLTSVDIGIGITTIGTGAFYNNNIPQGSAIIRRTSGTVTLGTAAFDQNGPLRNTTITPTYIP